MAVRIRLYRPTDFPALLAWSTETAWEQIPPAARPEASPAELGRRVREVFEHALRMPGTKVFVAEDDRKPVGYAGVVLVADELTGAWTGHVFDIYVEPARRGTGLARSLLEAVETECRVQGCQRMSATVSCHNAASLGLFARAGFAAERQMLGKPL